MCVKNVKVVTTKIEIKNKFSKTVEGNIGTKAIWSMLKCNTIKTQLIKNTN